MNGARDEDQLLAVVIALLLFVGAVLVTVALIGNWGTAVVAASGIPGVAYGPTLARSLRVRVLVWQYSRRLRRW